LACVLVAAPVHLLGEAARCIHRAKMQIGIINAGTVLAGAGRLVAILLLWRNDAVSVVAVLAIEASALLVIALTGLLTIRRSIGAFRPRFRQVRPAVWSLLRYGFAFQAYSLAYNLIPKVSIIGLHALRGDAATGHFVVAARLADYIVIFTTNINFVIVPFVAQMALKSDRKAFTALTCRMSVLILLPATIAAIALSPLVIPLLYGPSFAGSVVPFQILAVAMALATLFQFSGSLAIASGELRGLVVVAIGGLMVGCAALLLLIPAYGAVGAAVAVLIAYASAVVLHFTKLRFHDGISLAEFVIPRTADLARVFRRASPVPTVADGARS
jgi:O-antigen/teichoic acid export membrane protein